MPLQVLGQLIFAQEHEIIAGDTAAAHVQQAGPDIQETHFGTLLAIAAGSRGKILHHGTFAGGAVLLQVALHIFLHLGIPTLREPPETGWHLPALGVHGHIGIFCKAHGQREVTGVAPAQTTGAAIVIAAGEQHRPQHGQSQTCYTGKAEFSHAHAADFIRNRNGGADRQLLGQPHR